MELRSMLRPFCIGLTCGLRSMTGPAVVRWRAHDPARLALAALAAGELIADKLPSTPARTIPPALVFRAFSGGWCGRGVAHAFGTDLTDGAIAGALGAVVAAFVGMTLRGAVVRASHLPDSLVAVAEDGLALYGAIAASGP